MHIAGRHCLCSPGVYIVGEGVEQLEKAEARTIPKSTQTLDLIRHSNPQLNYASIIG